MKKTLTRLAMGMGVAAALVWTANSLQAAPAASHATVTYTRVVSDTTDTTKTPAPDTTTKPDSTPAPDTTSK
jgi:hypothetical protein